MQNILNSGLLGGNLKGDVTVTVQFEQSSLIMLFVLVIAIVLFSLVAGKMLR